MLTFKGVDTAPTIVKTQSAYPVCNESVCAETVLGILGNTAELDKIRIRVKARNETVRRNLFNLIPLRSVMKIIHTSYS
jgi:hypothetical protein